MNQNSEGVVHDPENYERLLAAHETYASAKAASAAFIAAVQAARQEYQIADVLIVLAVPVLEDKGGVDQRAILYCGNSRNMGVLAAEALGSAKRTMRESRETFLEAIKQVDENMRSLDEIAQGDLPKSEDPFADQ